MIHSDSIFLSFKEILRNDVAMLLYQEIQKQGTETARVSGRE